jgi:flavin reductase (DIM6/NTAB) family NADH-FMN oxidoreductase RutF
VHPERLRPRRLPDAVVLEDSHAVPSHQLGGEAAGPLRENLRHDRPVGLPAVADLARPVLRIATGDPVHLVRPDPSLVLAREEAIEPRSQPLDRLLVDEALLVDDEAVALERFQPVFAPRVHARRVQTVDDPLDPQRRAWHHRGTVASDPQAPPQEFDVPLGGFFASAPEGIGQAFLDEIPSEEAMEIEAAGRDPIVEFRRTLGMFPTGVTIITTQVGDQVHGMTANAFMSVSLRPPLVLISVDRRARMHALLHDGRHYGISVLGDEQEALSDHFAGRADGELPEPRFHVVRETPLVEGAVAHLVARVVRAYWGGDHSLFLGHVEYARCATGQPLLFHGGRYQHLLADAPVFGALAQDQLDRLLAAGTERKYEGGEAIVRAGEPGSELYVVLEGSVRIERGERMLARFGAGEIVGEVAVLDGRPRSADIVAEGRVRCLAVSRESLREAIEAEPRVAWELLGVMASRLRDA